MFQFSQSLEQLSFPKAPALSWTRLSVYTRRAVTLLVAGGICVLSYPVVKNVLSPSQVRFCVVVDCDLEVVTIIDFLLINVLNVYSYRDRV